MEIKKISDNYEITLEEYRKRIDEIESKGPKWSSEGDKWVGYKKWKKEVYKLQAQLSDEDLRTLIMSNLRFADRMNSEAGIEEEIPFEKETKRIKSEIEKYKQG